jgi:hypothetical protein
MAYIILLILLFGVVYLITQPFRRRAFAEAVGQEIVDEARPPELLELEAARDAKYREIRDAELDHETGKLSDRDFDAINSTLRTEAVSLLRELDEFHDQRGGVESALEDQGAAENAPTPSDSEKPATPAAPRNSSSTE